MQSSFVLLLASAIIAAPVLGQSQPPSNSSTKAARADSLGTHPKKPPAKKAQPAKTNKASATAKPGRKTWTGGRNGFVVDSAEAASLWPVKGPAPLPGTVVPAKRIVAYYGNPLVKKMGILGELPPDQMLAKLDTEVERWRKADPTTPVQPALHVIGVVAQGSAGRDGMWRARMSDSLIERVYSWAQKKNALLFIDVQVGHSTLQAELPRLAKFLERPDVHLGIDPEFSMKHGEVPGTKIGTFDANDVNYASNLLQELVTKEHLPPKVLVVHRFTRDMLTGYKRIKLDPRVQIVINMDGWGPPSLKRESYRAYIYKYPVEYTGFKIFYKNDTKGGTRIMSPASVLSLFPKPLYIQYQ